MKTDVRPMRSMTVDLRSSRSFLSPGMDEWKTFWKLKEHSGLEARRADLRTKEVDYRLEGASLIPERADLNLI